MKIAAWLLFKLLRSPRCDNNVMTEARQRTVYLLRCDEGRPASELDPWELRGGGGSTIGNNAKRKRHF